LNTSFAFNISFSFIVVHFSQFFFNNLSKIYFFEILNFFKFQISGLASWSSDCIGISLSNSWVFSAILILIRVLDFKRLCVLLTLNIVYTWLVCIKADLEPKGVFCRFGLGWDKKWLEITREWTLDCQRWSLVVVELLDAREGLQSSWSKYK